MKSITKLLLVALALLTSACAHPIVITPDTAKLDRGNVKQSSKTVGYYISEADRKLEVTTPGGGGDKVTYKPYAQLEPALQKVLSNKFRRVYSLSRPDDSAEIRQKGISYVFIPAVSTESSSKSAFTWPPTNFSVTLNCRAVDNSGKTIWQKNIVGKGEAEFKEFKLNYSLSAQRASLNTFKMLEQELNKEPKFR